MATRLPDELLKDVLLIVLRIPDERFEDTSGSSPFANVSVSSSAVLLACKRWMRISTPALYDTIILRSTAQMHSLCRALEQHPKFARLIERIRLEVLCPTNFGDLAKRLVSLKDVCFAIHHPGDTPRLTGIVKFMRGINPRSARFANISISSNTWTLWNQLKESAVKWTALVRQECMISRDILIDHPRQRTITFPTAQKQSYNYPADLAVINMALSVPCVEELRIPIRAATDLRGILDRLQPMNLFCLLEKSPKPTHFIFVLQNAHQVNYKFLSSFFPETTHRSVFFFDTTSSVKESLHDRLITAADDFPMWLHRSFELAPHDAKLSVLRLIIRFAIALDAGQPTPLQVYNSWFDSTSLDITTCSSLLRTSRDFAVSLLLA